jgi:hypothetical protein
MRVTIQFNGKPFQWTVEVHHVTPDAMLTAELIATEIALPKDIP